jgi:protein phosphatase
VQRSEAEQSHLSHVLYNAVVASDDTRLQPEVYRVNLEVEDTLVLCTDGLTKHVAPGEIVELVQGSRSAARAARALVEAAREGGGTDNITTVVSRFIHGNTGGRAA